MKDPSEAIGGKIDELDEVSLEISSLSDPKTESTVKNSEDSLNKLSKRQLKRIRKKERWDLRKGEKRLKERRKAKEKRALARANNIDLGPSRRSLKKCLMADSPCKVIVTIDMAFDDLMINKDIAKLIKQILRCYTLNRRASAPMQLSVTNFSGKSKEQMEKHNGYQHWDVNFHEESYSKVYQTKKIIYLTSESENVIDELEQDCVYVIGGLVDHNCQKFFRDILECKRDKTIFSLFWKEFQELQERSQGLCHNLAQKAGIEHARLPLDKFLKMKTRKVLTIDHVFEILLRVTEGKTWQESFLQVLPQRKNAEPVSTRDDDSSTIESNDDESEVTIDSIDDKS